MTLSSKDIQSLSLKVNSKLIDKTEINQREKGKKQNKEQAYVFWHLQDSKHKEDVFLAILELLVFKVSIDLAISQCELFGQVFEVGSDVGFGFGVSLKPKAPACSIYLLQ